MHVQFDTQAIGLILDRDDLAEALADAASRENWFLSVSRTVLDETFAMNNERFQLERARRLLQLRLRLRNKFFLALSLHDLIDKELSERIHSPVELPPAENQLLYGLLDMAVSAGNRQVSHLGEVPTWVRNWKDLREVDSVKHRQESATLYKKQGWKVRTIGETLDRYSMKDLDWLIAAIVRRRFKRERYQMSSIHARPKRFKALLSWAALATLVMYSEFIPNDRLHEHPNTRMLRRTRNDWYDAAVAAAAAYSDVLVTGDVILSQRCAFLRQRGQLHFCTITLTELLPNAAPDT